MGGEFTYQPKWDPKTVLTTTATWNHSSASGAPGAPSMARSGEGHVLLAEPCGIFVASHGCGSKIG